jgi:hypothetical protein
MNWLNNFKLAVIAITCVLVSSCCIGYDDYHKLLTDEQAAWVPDSTLKSFIMENEHGIKESYVLDSFQDTIITMINDKCDCETVFQRRSAAYISTFNNSHHFEIRLNTINYTDMDIGLNWNQHASWDFDKNEQIPHSYTSNNYPNPTSISIVSDKTIKGLSYPKVMNLKFAPADVEETGIIEADFIPLMGIVHYKLKNGVSYYRKPMP